MKNIFIIIFSMALALPATAQEELGTHFMRGVWQANKTNPALLPEGKFVIGLPGVYNNLNITSITYNDLVIDDANGDPVLDIDNAIAELEDDNRIRENLEVETISLAIRLGDVMLSAGHSTKFNAFLNYPKTLPQLIWQGNAQFIGQNVDFGSDLQLFGYNEFFLGAALNINKNLTIGARAKWLSGFGDVSTDRTRLNLLTEEEAYRLTLDADFRVNSTGSIAYDGFRDFTVNYDFASFEGEQLFNQNNGLAFDLGAHLQLGRLDLAASVLDLGGTINWEENVQNFTLNGTFPYQGLDVAQDILNDEENLGNAIDTLLETYEFVETQETYTTDLPLRYYLSGSYQLNDTWRLGGMLYNETYRDETFTAAAVGANVQLFSWLNAGATYAFRSERFDNLGVNTNMQFGPVQLITMTDNLLSALRPQDTNSANVRVGLNLVFK
jgi:hypothetical protein